VAVAASAAVAVDSVAVAVVVDVATSSRVRTSNTSSRWTVEHLSVQGLCGRSVAIADV